MQVGQQMMCVRAPPTAVRAGWLAVHSLRGCRRLRACMDTMRPDHEISVCQHVRRCDECQSG
jgi:hypothetical protein